MSTPTAYQPPVDAVDTFSLYRLPDGQIVRIHDDVARGAETVSYTLVGGVVVDAVRWPDLPADDAAEADADRATDLDLSDVDQTATLRDPARIAEALTAPAAQVAPERNRVLDNTLCLALNVNRLGVRRKASMAAVTVASDKALLSMSKKLLQSANIIRINRIVAQTREYLKTHALPSFFKAGIWLVPDMMVPQIEAHLIIQKAEFDAAVADFLVEYAGDETATPPRLPLAAQMADGLGVLYNPTDYPSVGKVAAAFGMDWRFVGFDVPGRLRAISAAMYEQEQAKAQREIAEATDEIKIAMRAGLAELIDNMVAKLQPTEDGKKRRLHATSVENLQTFLANFDMRNVTGDTELAAMVDRARAVMAGKDVEQLRADGDLRGRVQAAFAAIQADMQPLVVGRHARAFDVEDESGDEAAE